MDGKVREKAWLAGLDAANDGLPSTINPHLVYSELAIELAWLAGVLAGRDRLPFDDNPHPGGTDLSRDWADGWLEGERIRRMC